MEVVKQDGQMVVKTSARMEVQLEGASRGQHQIGIAQAQRWSVRCGIWLLGLWLLLFAEPKLEVQWELRSLDALL